MGLFSFSGNLWAGNEFLSQLEPKLPQLQRIFEERLAPIESSLKKLLEVVQVLNEDFPPFHSLMGGLTFRAEGLNAFRAYQLQAQAEELRLNAFQWPAWDVLSEHGRELYLKYSYAIPNDEAIETISKFSPLIEVGAGSGYWAKLLTDQGADILAFDNYSWTTLGDAYKNSQTWFDVKKADESILTSDSGRTLFLCWPPRGSQFSSNALKNYQGKTVIYVGETPDHPGLRFFDTIERQPSMANRTFFDLLKTKFHLIKTVSIPNWPGYQDQVYIYERNE